MTFLTPVVFFSSGENADVSCFFVGICGVERQPLPNELREREGEDNRRDVFRQKGNRRTRDRGTHRNAVHRSQLQYAAEMTDQKPRRAEQDAERPTQSATAKTAGKSAEEYHRQKPVKEPARGSDEFGKSALQIGEHGKTERAEKKIDADGAEPEFPTDHKAAERDGKGLERHGNAEKVDRDGDHGEYRDDGGKERGEGDFEGTGAFHGESFRETVVLRIYCTIRKP